MPERLEKLQVAIQELERELASADELDEGTRQQLEHARGEIREALQRETSPDEWQPTSLIERLTTLEQDFEQSHPTLSGVTRRLIFHLGQMGI